MNEFILKISASKGYHIILNKKSLVSCSGWRVTIFMPYIKESIKKLKSNENIKNNFQLSEVRGIKMAIMFRTSRNIKNMREVDNIFIRTKSLSREMTYYWFNQIFKYNNVNKYKKKISK